MPHFIIHCLDAPGALPQRLQHYDDHKAYLASARVNILVSGPLTSDDGKTMIGSFFLVEAPARKDVETFNAGDPFRRAGIWAEIRINAFHKRVDKLSSGS